MNVTVVRAETPSPVKLYHAIAMDDLAEVLLLEGLRFEQVPIDGNGVVANQRFDVSDGVDWSLFGYGCKDEAGCSELQTRSIFKAVNTEALVLRDLNDWNGANRFTRAYLVNATTIVLEMDIYLNGGQSLQNIREQISIWRQSVRRFSTTLAPPENAP